MSNSISDFRARTQETLAGLNFRNVNSPFVGGTSVYTPNQFDPTIVASKKGGAQLGIYDNLIREAHIQSMLELRLKAQTRRAWYLSPKSAVDGTEVSDTSPEMMLTNRMREWLEEFDYDAFVTAALQGALIYGISCINLEWATYDDGFTAPVKWTVIDPRRIRIDTNDQVRILTRDQSYEGVLIDPRLLFVTRFNDGRGLYPYGRGLGSTLYWIAEFKRTIELYMTSACQKSGMPTTVAETDKSLSLPAVNKILSSLRQQEGGGAIVLPDGLKAKLLNPQVQERLFKEALQYYDDRVTLLITGQKFASAGNGEGSRALGEVHNEIRLEYSEDDSKMFNTLFRDCVMTWITDINYPGENVPVIDRDFTTRAQKALAYRDMHELVDRGLTVVDYARKVKELTGFEVTGTPQPLQMGTPRQIPNDINNE